MWGCVVVIGRCVWRVHLRVSVCVGGKLVDKVMRLGFQGHVAGPVGIVVCYREYLGGLLRVGGLIIAATEEVFLCACCHMVGCRVCLSGDIWDGRIMSWSR